MKRNEQVLLALLPARVELEGDAWIIGEKGLGEAPVKYGAGDGSQRRPGRPG